MIKLFITGIAGMLGSNLAYALSDEFKISGADRNGCKLKKGCSYVIDLTDWEELKKVLIKESPDVIIHTAAAVNVDRCEKEHEYAERMNKELTEYICHLGKKIGSKIIYISTDAVFDGKKQGLYEETDRPNPINVYGQTKWQGEIAALKDSRNLILRTNIYGYNVRDKRSFGEWVTDGLREGNTLNMFTDIQFSPILVNELAEIIKKAIRKDLSGVYHACGTGAISKYDFGVFLKKIFGFQEGQIVKSKSSEFNFVAPRSRNMGMNNKKISEELQIKISTPEESIILFKELYDKNYSDKLKSFCGYGGKNEDRESVDN